MITRTTRSELSVLALVAALLVVLCTSNPTTADIADSQETGTVDWVLPRTGLSSQIILFQLSGTVEGRTTDPTETCVTLGSGNAEMWALPDPTSAVGRAQFALLLAAQLAGATVQVKGLDTCTQFNGIEDVFQMKIVND